jgi:hypothetical protein
MTESTEVTLKLPVLKKGSAAASDKKATARIQHILNDIAKEHPDPETYRPFRESGEFGDETKAAVIKFQEDSRNHIPQPHDGEVNHLTWAALLKSWVELPTHPLE